MTVYVDTMRAINGRMVMCHMAADTTSELVAMADRIGVAQRWIQHPGTYREHFDICLSKRRDALAAGAVEVSMMDLVRLMQRKRRTHHD